MDRRGPELETNGAWVSRWMKDTLRMWPILLLLGAFGYRAETTRDTVFDVVDDFVSEGPRVTTEGDMATTIEAELKDFQLKLADVYQPREIALLNSRYTDLQLEQIKGELAEIKEMLKGLMRERAEARR